MNNFKQRFDWGSYQMTQQSKESLYNYFVHGFEPGSFMRSVLSNNLFAAAGSADSVNTKLLGEYANWLVNHAPYQSYGSPEAVQGWLSQNQYFQQFQKELVAEQLAQPE